MQIALSFWKKWSHEYLQALQRRAKWHETKENVKIRDIVIVKNKLVPPSQWPLARIVELHPGSDRVAKATLKRPIAKIVKLVNSTDKGQ